MKIINYSKIFDDLFPICRSITGDGYRKSLKILSKFIKFKIEKHKSGSKVFDWKVPEEWNISEAYVLKDKQRVIDFKKNNLHVVNYSTPINKKISLNKFQKHLFSLKKYPNFIPYVTSYYKKFWGFCIEHKKRTKLKKGTYHVVIKSKIKKGYVEYGIKKIKGNSNKIMLLTSYLCHPSMANNELSGPLVMLGLYQKILGWKKRNLNYYFLINPETIGSICFLSRYGNFLKKNLHSGLVLNSLGGPKQKLTYKKSRRDNSSLDRIFHYFANKKKCLIRNFDPTEGSDERQYCSSEFNLPMGQVGRTVAGNYYQYHNSGDTKKFMKISQITKSINTLNKILKLNDLLFPIKRYQPYCELQLGKRNLYPNLNSDHTRKKSNDNLIDSRNQLDILLYVLSYADENSDILDLAIKTGFDIKEILKIIDVAIKKNLLKKDLNHKRMKKFVSLLNSTSSL